MVGEKVNPYAWNEALQLYGKHKVKHKYEGSPILGTCPVCGEPVYVDQACYDPEGHKGKVFLHVGCAESMKTVFILEVKDSPGSGLVCGYLKEVFDNLHPMMKETELGEGYTVTKSEMTNLKYYALGEHEGF